MANRAETRRSSPTRSCDSLGSRNLRLGSPRAPTPWRLSKAKLTRCSPRPTPIAICPPRSPTRTPDHAEHIEVASGRRRGRVGSRSATSCQTHFELVQLFGDLALRGPPGRQGGARPIERSELLTTRGALAVARFAIQSWAAWQRIEPCPFLRDLASARMRNAAPTPRP